MSLQVTAQPVVAPVVPVVAPVVAPGTPVVAPPAPKPGTPEYDAEMVRVAQAARGEVENETPEPDGSAKSTPDGVPEKFLKDGVLDTEALLKSYKELEQKFSAPKTPVAPASAPVTPAPAQAVAGIPVADLASEVMTSGDLTPETRTKLTASGIPEDYINSYLEMFKASQAAETVMVAQKELEIKNSVGGEQAYTQLAQWAAVSLTAGEIAAYDNMVSQGGDISLMAVQGLKARYEAKMGSLPGRQVSGTPSGKSDVFSDRAEFLEAMADKRYGSSEAYRNQLQAKLSRTRQSGVQW